MIIAIDGPSGTGKGTVGRIVADRLGIVYFDTGAMYRAFALLCHQAALAPELLLDRFAFRIERREGTVHYFIGDQEVTEAIRAPEVTQASSELSALPFVRERMVEEQRRFGASCDALFEGRDIGTVVFPAADVKIYLTARPEVRAERRYQELLGKGVETSLEEVAALIEERDHLDSTRAHSPLRRAEDAHLIDTSDLTVEQVVEKVLEVAQ